MLQAGGLVEPGVKVLAEPGDLVGDGLVVSVVDHGGADVAARGEHVVVPADLIGGRRIAEAGHVLVPEACRAGRRRDRKSTRLNSSHSSISYAVFCLKKKKQ